MKRGRLLDRDEGRHTRDFQHHVIGEALRYLWLRFANGMISHHL
jgi:hypothetical protein